MTVKCDGSVYHIDVDVDVDMSYNAKIQRKITKEEKAVKHRQMLAIFKLKK